MHIYYEYPDTDGDGDYIYVDASVREHHSETNAITRLPVEKGIDVTDHSRKQPAVLTIEGVISNHPPPRVLDVAGAPGQFTSVDLESGDRVTAYQYPSQLSRSQTDYQRLLFVKEQAYLCDMVTSLKRYENMVIESIEVERTVDKGNAVHFTMRAVQIRIAQSQVVGIVRPKQPRAKPGKDLGAKPAKEVPPSKIEAEKKSSLLSSITGLGKFIS